MSRARALVSNLVSSSREAGTPQASLARLAVARFLVELGYSVEEQPFTFNAGVYRALPVAGATLAALSLIELPLLLRPAPAWGALVMLLSLAAALGIVSSRIMRGDGPPPGQQRDDANIIARRAGASIRCWLIAHLDTKAQAQSMAGRLVALWVTVVTVSGLVALVIVRLGGPLRAGPVVAVVAGCCLAGLLVSRGRLTGSSPGARDNGSGLLAVLTAAELATDSSIGIIITAAEEFGLVGARALARERPGLFSQASVLNVDTVDDEGTLFVVTHDRGSAALAGRVRARLAGLAPRCTQRRLPLGIMVDSLPLAPVALEAATVGRVTWGTLRLVHTARDHADGHRLATAERLGERLAFPI